MATDEIAARELKSLQDELNVLQKERAAVPVPTLAPEADSLHLSADQRAGMEQAALRAAHLKYHLAATEVHSPTQIQRYAELRGYTSGGPADHPHTTPTLAR